MTFPAGRDWMDPSLIPAVGAVKVADVVTGNAKSQNAQNAQAARNLARERSNFGIRSFILRQ